MVIASGLTPPLNIPFKISKAERMFDNAPSPHSIEWFSQYITFLVYYKFQLLLSINKNENIEQCYLLLYVKTETVLIICLKFYPCA